MELFRRLPRPHPLPAQPQEILEEEKRVEYPALAAEFAILQEKLVPPFRELDNEALNCQNRYRFMYLILIVGSALATIFIIFQIALINLIILDVIGGIIALILTIATSSLQAFKYQERYFNARLGAERLRSEYFLFLGHLGQYKGADRVQQLERRINKIKRGAEIDGIA